MAIAKLDEVLPEGDERAWFRERLLPLLGIESGSSAGRDEQFTAWRRFLELLAAQRPTVLVFEDLHWADEAMLAFLEELAAHAAGGAAARHRDDAAGAPRAAAGLPRARPTARPDRARAAAGRRGHDDLLRDAGRRRVDRADGSSTPILERAAGNPLFAEEFIRLLRDRDLLVTADGVTDLRDGAELPVPDTIQALLAARIDALPSATKAMLGDAAVIGKVFWAGAVAAMGERPPDEVRAAMDGLARRELVRPQPRSSMAGEAEYAFWHVLARDVAYAAMPAPAARRGTSPRRGGSNRRPATGSRTSPRSSPTTTRPPSISRSRVGDERARRGAAPAGPPLPAARRQARPRARLPVALRLLERAVALAPAGHPDRPSGPRAYGDALGHDGRYRDAVAAYEEAVDLFRRPTEIRRAP